jgi:hypothetical protein
MAMSPYPYRLVHAAKLRLKKNAKFHMSCACGLETETPLGKIKMSIFGRGPPLRLSLLFPIPSVVFEFLFYTPDS